MKKAEFIEKIIEGYSWSPGEKLEFSKEKHYDSYL